jgi:hypothetical protein
VVVAVLTLCALPFIAGVGFAFLGFRQARVEHAVAMEERAMVAEAEVAMPMAPEGPGGAPGVPMPPPNLDVIKQPSVRLALNTKNGNVSDIVFAPESDQLGHFSFREGPGLQPRFFDLWNWKQPQRLARLEIPDQPGAFVALSPKGTRLLTHLAKQKGVNIRSLPDGNLLKKEWRPFADQPDPGFAGVDRADIAWAAFLDEENLLTITYNGRFGVWNANFDKPKYTVEKRRDIPAMMSNVFSRGPQNMALSDDRKTLALANGDGFELFDASTGKLLRTTESMKAMGRVGNVWGVAFNRDGTLLATTQNISIKAEPAKEHLTIWNVADGKRTSHFLLENHVKTKGPLTWFGDKHLVIWDGNIFQGAVFSLGDGRYHRVIEKGNGDRFARQHPGNRLWYASALAFGADAELFAVDFPFEELQKNPAPAVNLDQLPRWRVGTQGIGRVGP